MKKLSAGLAGLAFASLLAAGGFAFGFATRGADSGTIMRLYERATRKLDALRGLPTPEEQAVAQFESTFIRFKGKLYHLPNSHWIKGGGLTVWDDTLILVDRNGTLYHFDDDKGLLATAIETPENGADDYAELVKAPEYAGQVHKPDSVRFNDVLYVDSAAAGFRGLILSYTFFDREKLCHGSRLARLALKDVAGIEEVSAAAGDWEVFFETTPCLPFRRQGTALEGIQAGGRMALHPDGRLIFGSGDYAHDGIDTPDIGLMDPAVLYGKVIAIDIPTGDYKVLSVGHRNLQGVAVNSKGEIWTVEHGVRGGDELNLIREGLNYGWPKEGLGTLYTGQPLPFPGPPGRHDHYARPAFAWLPSAATSALTAIDDFDPTWDGDLLAGSLSSPEFGQSLYHIRTDGNSVVFVERIELGHRVRYVTQFGKRLALWLDLTDLLILTPVPREDPLSAALAALREAQGEDIAAQAEARLKTCNECHSFLPGQHGAGPSLDGVVGRKVANTTFQGYSDALRQSDGVWSESRLKTFVSNPEGFAPGTAMPPIPATDDRILDALVFALKQMDTKQDEHLKY